MRWLEPSEIVAINSVVTTPYGESCFVTDQASVTEAAEAQKTAGSPVEAAGALLEVLLERSPFAAGNVRTGAVAALWLLDQEGLSIDAPDQDFANGLRRIKNERWDRSRIATWLSGQLRATTAS